jgi:hypothetical protein
MEKGKRICRASFKKIDDDTLQGIAEIEISGENTKKWQKIIVKNFYGWSKEIKYE